MFNFALTVYPSLFSQISILLLSFLSILFSCCNSNWSSTAAGVNVLKNLQNNEFDIFHGTRLLEKYSVNNPLSLPEVMRANGRYCTNLTSNAHNITLHFNASQGRIDAKEVPFPFEVIARNFGIEIQNDSQVAPASPSSRYIFASLQVHVVDFN